MALCSQRRQGAAQEKSACRRHRRATGSQRRHHQGDEGGRLRLAVPRPRAWRDVDRERLRNLDAAQDSGIAPIVRVPYGELAMATRMLDGGALGIVIPHVDTAEEAARDRRPAALSAARPSLGRRRPGAVRLRADEDGRHDQESNDNTLITVMIETPKAVRNAEAIAAVPGIDGLLVGSSDLSVEMGIPGENGHPKIQEAVDKVVAACKKHGKFPGHGRRLQRGAAAALHRQGHEAAAGRQRPADADQRRPHAPGQGAGDGQGAGEAESGGEEEVDAVGARLQSGVAHASGPCAARVLMSATRRLAVRKS